MFESLRGAGQVAEATVLSDAKGDYITCGNGDCAVSLSAGDAFCRQVQKRWVLDVAASEVTTDATFRPGEITAKGKEYTKAWKVRLRYTYIYSSECQLFHSKHQRHHFLMSAIKNSQLSTFAVSLSPCFPSEVQELYLENIGWWQACRCCSKIKLTALALDRPKALKEITFRNS